MHIGVIPARAGSKRLPGKNRKILGDDPLWVRSVNKSVRHMDKTFVNTDDELILAWSFYAVEKWAFTCQKYKRPENLSGDMTSIDDVLIEMAKTLGFSDNDIIHLFQPTNPFICDKTIKAVKKSIDVNECDSVQSIAEVPNIYHSFSQRYLTDSKVTFIFPGQREICYNAQTKPKHYIFAGYVAFRVESLLKYNNIWGETSIGLETSGNFYELIDIDTEEDLENARLIISAGIAS